MADEDEDVKSWAELPAAERRAIRRAAQSQIWWTQLGEKIKATAPLVTAILGLIALWNLAGEWLKEVLSAWLGK